jgi:hypothetical protein
LEREKNKAKQEKNKAKQEKVSQKLVPLTKAKRTSFACLAEDEDSDNEEAKTKVVQKNTIQTNKVLPEQFPALSNKTFTPSVQPIAKMSYAQLASKTKEEYENEQFMKKLNQQKHISLTSKTTQIRIRPKITNWADDSSDTEDEDEDN